jgi:hypothetical protein
MTQAVTPAVPERMSINVIMACDSEVGCSAVNSRSQTNQFLHG